MIMMRTVAFLVILPGLFFGQQGQDSFIQEYKIGPKDLLEIKVQEVPELASVSVRVSEDGSTTPSLSGNIAQAGGLTESGKYSGYHDQTDAKGRQ